MVPCIENEPKAFAILFLTAIYHISQTATTRMGIASALGFILLTRYSISCQLIGSKSNPTFSPVKILYRVHSSLNTASR